MQNSLKLRTVDYKNTSDPKTKEVMGSQSS